MQDRRQAERFLLNLPARWESLLAEGRGTVSDLSAGGCFLFAAGKVLAGELIRVELDFGKHAVFAWGRVVYAIDEMGFALRFVFNEPNEERALRNLIDRLVSRPFDTDSPLS